MQQNETGLAYGNKCVPATFDQTYKYWTTRAGCVLEKNGKLESFQSLQTRKYPFGNHKFFRYRQMRDYFLKEKWGWVPPWKRAPLFK